MQGDDGKVKVLGVEWIRGLNWPLLLDRYMCETLLLFDLYRGQVAVCPACGYQLTGKAKRTWGKWKKVRCKKCGKFFSARTGTILAGGKLSITQYFILLMGLAMGGSDAAVADVCGIHRDTVRLWRLKLSTLEGGVDKCKVTRKLVDDKFKTSAVVACDLYLGADE